MIKTPFEESTRQKSVEEDRAMTPPPISPCPS